MSYRYFIQSWIQSQLAVHNKDHTIIDSLITNTALKLNFNSYSTANIWLAVNNADKSAPTGSKLVVNNNKILLLIYWDAQQNTNWFCTKLIIGIAGVLKLFKFKRGVSRNVFIPSYLRLAIKCRTWRHRIKVRQKAPLTDPTWVQH